MLVRLQFILLRTNFTMKKIILLITVVFISIGLNAQTSDIESLKKWVVEEINNNYEQGAKNTIGEKVDDVKVAFQGNNLFVKQTNTSYEYGERVYKMETIIPLSKINDIPLFTDAIDISDSKTLDISIYTSGDEDIIEKQTSEDGDVQTNMYNSLSIYMKMSYGTDKVNKLIEAIKTIAKATK